MVVRETLHEALSPEVVARTVAAEAEATTQTSTLHLLLALANVAPSRCLDLLGAQSGEVRSVVDANHVSTILLASLDALPRPYAEHRRAISRAFEKLRDVLSAEAAGACLSALGQPLTPSDRESLKTVFRRHPQDAALLRHAVALAQSDGDRVALDALLTRLGHADPSPSTVAWIRRTRHKHAPDQRTDIKIALLSSFTIDPLVPFIDLACRGIDIVPELYVAPFNSWTRDVVDDASGLRAFAPDIAFLSVAVDDLIPELAGDMTAARLVAAGESALVRVMDVVRHFTRAYAGKTLVVHSFHSAFTTDGTGGQALPSRAQWLAALNAQLVAAVHAEQNCHVLDVTNAVVLSGGTLRDNPKLRHLAGMRLAPGALAAVGDAYARFIAPLKGLRRKCVVLDLDNTLWGGVVGEDGSAGIRLGNTAPGSEYVEFQHYLRSLCATGMLLAINSKNNSSDALDVLRTHDAMVLREADFSAIRINWEPKPQNMRDIARELNIGLDALIFVDDNPEERERMRQMLPDVLTVELPKDPALYRATLERLPQLQALEVTLEDRLRVDQYRTAKVRERARDEASNVDEYLTSLHLEATIARVDSSIVSRVAQLFARTNQFNTTTRRYSPSEVQAFCSDAGRRLWALRSHDKFGDHGLVAVALVDMTPTIWRIDSLLMSCRVIGYGIEDALLAFIAGRAHDEGASRICGDFIETNKNAPARDLYARRGFEIVERAGGVERWACPLPNASLVHPHWIALSADDA